MSFTQNEQLFAGIHELGINDLLAAFFGARPRYLNYGTVPFVSYTSAAETNIPVIEFPGIFLGIDYAITFSVPTVDIYPDSSGGTSAVIPGPGQFTIKTEVTISLLCRGVRGAVSDQPGKVIKTRLRVFGLCRPWVVNSAPGSGEITIFLDRVEIVDITPNQLEQIIECLIFMMLQVALLHVRLPFNAFTAGAFGLILLVGPEADTDQIKVRGNAL